MGLDALNVESRPLWKPMRIQQVYKEAPAFVKGVLEGMCLPSGSYVSEDDARFIVDAITDLIKCKEKHCFPQSMLTNIQVLLPTFVALNEN